MVEVVLGGTCSPLERNKVCPCDRWSCGSSGGGRRGISSSQEKVSCGQRTRMGNCHVRREQV